MNYEPAQIRTFLFGAFIAVVFGLAIFGAAGLVLARLGLRPISRLERRAAALFLTCAALGVACVGYGLLEPDWLSITHVEIPTAKLPEGQRIRIVHLSDLHVGGRERVLDELPEQVNALAPDLVIYTGDSIQKPEDAPLFREVLRSLSARFGRFAVRGNHDIWYFEHVDLFGDGVAHELTGTATTAGGLTLCGSDYDQPRKLLRCLEENRNGLRIAVHHTPDYVEEAAVFSPDLYLAGHTHGGQVRLPFYGALITMSRFDKKYEMGLYQVDQTALFVTRGVGVEPPPAPRIRFLCRPEIAVIDLVGAQRGSD